MEGFLQGLDLVLECLDSLVMFVGHHILLIKLGSQLLIPVLKLFNLITRVLQLVLKALVFKLGPSIILIQLIDHVFESIDLI